MTRQTKEMSERLVDYANGVWSCPSFDRLEAEANGETFNIIPENGAFAMYDEDNMCMDRGTVEKCMETFAEFVNEAE